MGIKGFNTQPPEGGWGSFALRKKPGNSFNTQPPEGGWLLYLILKNINTTVSTLSRLKAAGDGMTEAERRKKVSTLSRLKAAGKIINVSLFIPPSFNTQPPEGGWFPVV